MRPDYGESILYYDSTNSVQPYLESPCHRSSRILCLESLLQPNESVASIFPACLEARLQYRKPEKVMVSRKDKPRGADVAPQGAE
jgi:hypothetical protein